MFVNTDGPRKLVRKSSHRERLATIRFKEGSVPKKEPAFRLKGEREDGFHKLMDKFIKNGWIRPCNSAWGSRAFVVPKPGRPGEYRMVVDYCT